MHRKEIKKKLETELFNLLQTKGFVSRGDSFVRSDSLSEERLELEVQQGLGNEYKIFLRLNTTIQEVNKVLVDTFGFSQAEIPATTVSKSSLFMEPKGRWDVRGPKGAAAIAEEVKSYVLTDVLKHFNKTRTLTGALETLVQRKFDSNNWHWHPILAIIWMLKDSRGLSKLLEKIRDFLEKVAPDDDEEFQNIYAHFQKVEPSFFPTFTINQQTADKTAKKICLKEKLRWDAQIKRTLKFGKTPRNSEPCTLFVIYGSEGSLRCNDDGWLACYDAVRPLIACIGEAHKTSRYNSSSSTEDEFTDMRLWISSKTNSEPPKLLLVVNKRNTVPNARFIYNPTIILLVRSNQSPDVQSIAESCAKTLAEISNSLLLAKQIRPYWMEQSMDFGIHCPEEGISTLLRRGSDFRRGELIDTLEGTWELIPPE